MAFTHNIYLLYFLFFATLVHLGYFILISEKQSLILFSLMFLFLYFIYPNMIIVLGISLLFVDFLYILKRPEGFNGTKKETEKSQKSQKSQKSEENEESKDSKEYPLKDTNPNTKMNTNKIKITPMNESAENTVQKIKEVMTNRKDSVEVEESGTKEKGRIGGKELREVQEESKKMKDELEKIKKSPELVKAFNTMYGLDIGEINKLMNNLSSVADAFSSS